MVIGANGASGAGAANLVNLEEFKPDIEAVPIQHHKIMVLIALENLATDVNAIVVHLVQVRTQSVQYCW